MALAKLMKNAFTAGELSPRMKGRSDLPTYFKGVEILENWLIYPQGGIYRRPGTRFVVEVKTSANANGTIVVAFSFSDTQEYILEMGDQYIRFFKQTGRIESPPGTPVEISSPYLFTDLPRLKFAQSADTLYIAHPSYAPRKLTRTSDTAWTLTTIAFIDGPYRDENTDSGALLTVSLNTVGTGRTMTASGTLTFSSDQVGALWRVKGNTTYGYVTVTAFTDSTHVTVDVKTVLDFPTPGTSTTSLWREGAWSTKRGFPAAVTINSQRLVWAGWSGEPQRVAASKTGSFENYTPGTTDADPWVYQIGSSKVNVIQWLAPSSRGLLIGTVGEEFLMRGASTAGDITPTSVDVKPHTSYGSNLTAPLRVSEYVLFVQYAGTKLFQLQYNFAFDAYSAPDLTFFSEHITGAGGLTYMAYAQEPDRQIFAVRTDGQLAILTFYAEADINVAVRGWSRLKTGTYASDTMENFESVAAIHSTDKLTHQVWAVVKRTVNGVTKRYIEYFDPLLHTDAAVTLDNTNLTATLTPGATTGAGVIFTASMAAFASGDVGKYLVALPVGTTAPATGVGGQGLALITAFTDSAHVMATIQTDFPSTAAIPAGNWGLGVTSFSGLNYLAGRTVNLVGDGAVYAPNQVVSAGGTISIPAGTPPIVKAEIGIPFTATLVTMRPEIGGQGTTLSMERKRFGWVRVRVSNTVGLQIFGYDVATRQLGVNPLGMPVPAPVSADIDLMNAQGWSYDAQITITQTQPIPTIINAVMGRLESSDPSE